MIHTLLASFLLCVLASVSIAGTTLYKGLDAEGKVVYSDKPFEDAEKFAPPSISVVGTHKADTAEKKAAVEQKTEEFKYIKFDIVSPKNKQTIWNEAELSVVMKLVPALNNAQGHTAWLLLDGKPVVKNSKTLSLQAGRIDRGAHQLQGQVRDKEGKIIVRTRAIAVYIRQASVN